VLCGRVLAQVIGRGRESAFTPRAAVSLRAWRFDTLHARIEAGQGAIATAQSRNSGRSLMSLKRALPACC